MANRPLSRATLMEHVGGIRFDPGTNVVDVFINSLRNKLDPNRVNGGVLLGDGGAVGAIFRDAGLTPADIAYVEAHGTGTPLGDPVEVAALSEVFAASTHRKGFCALGSIKTNIGHLDAAAGVAGLIKAVLAVERGVLPPSLNFATPNPRIDFARSPFYVNTECRPWRPEGWPRRAGVSAFSRVLDDGCGGGGGVQLDARLYTPPHATGEEPLLVYFHQGGGVLGGLWMCDVWCSILAEDARCVVLNVDYRHAPEHKFPAAVDDAIAAFAWAEVHARGLGADGRRAAVGGDRLERVVGNLGAFGE